MWRFVFVVDPSFPSISVDVSQLVDGQGVLLVQRGAVQLLGSLDGLLGCGVFDERISECTSVDSLRSFPGRAVPFCEVVLAQGHENCIFFRLPHSVELLQKKFDQLFFASLRDLWQSIDNDESVQTLFHSDIIILSEICDAS